MTNSKNYHWVRACRRASAIALTLTGLVAASLWADSNNTESRLRTFLAGGAMTGMVPSGNADFRSEPDRNRTRLNVEVEKVNMPDGTVLSVFVSHAGSTVKVGEIHLRLGFGELELNSQDGAAVPAIMKQDMVTVNNAGGAILTGVF